MKALQWETKRVRLTNRVELPYYTVGHGLPVLLANGLGGGREVWSELVAHSQDRYRFVTWDYRGLQGRDVDGGDAGDAHTILGVPSHAHDALSILDAENTARAAIVGWSMGVSVALEIFSQAPGRVSSLALCCGSARVSWARGAARSLPALLFLRALHLARRSPRASRLLLQMGLQSPEAFTWARRLGIVGEQVSPDLFTRIASALLDFDLARYVGTLDRLAEYDATPVLSQVDVPTLVIGGGRDPFTARAGLEELAQGIAGAEYLLLADGTHYLLLDQAERVNLRIEKFWNERGYAAG